MRISDGSSDVCSSDLKNAVAAGLADRVEVQVAYAIGTASPVGLYVESFGTANVPEDRILAAIQAVFDLRAAAIIRDLDLLPDRKSDVEGMRVSIRLNP